MNQNLARIAIFAAIFIFCARAFAEVSAIQSSDFLPSRTVVGFETGSNELPFVQGVGFPLESLPYGPNWFQGTVTSGFFGRQGWSNVSNIGGYSNLAAVFAPPVEAVGGWFGQIPNTANRFAGEMEVRIFDEKLLLVEDANVKFTPALHSPVWVGYHSTSLIRRIEFRVGQFADTGFFAGDNLTFGSVVPEPTTATLLLLGMLGCGWQRHR